MKVGRRSKAIISLSIICVFIISSLCAGKIIIKAADNLIIAPVGEIEAVAGERIDIPVYIRNNPGIMGFGFIISYNSDYVKPVSAKAGEALSGGRFIDSIDTSDTQKNSKFKIFWSDVGNMNSDGELFILSFNVKENAGFESTVISISNSQADTFNENWDDVVPEFEDIRIVLKQASTNTAGPVISPEPGTTSAPSVSPTPIPSDIADRQYVLYGEDVNADEDGNVSIPVSLINNYGIMGMGILVEYDKDVLEPVNVVAGDILKQGTFEDSIQPSSSGNYKIYWSSTDDMTSDGEAFTLNFKTVGQVNEDTTVVKLSCLTNDTFDETWKTVNLVCNDVTVKLTGGGQAVALPGDINGDGYVTNKDSTRLLQYLAKWEVSVVEQNLDVNGDGSINGKDATRLLRYLAGWDVEIY